MDSRVQREALSLNPIPLTLSFNGTLTRPLIGAPKLLRTHGRRCFDSGSTRRCFRSPDVPWTFREYCF